MQYRFTSISVHETKGMLMANKAGHDEKLANLVKSALPLTPFEQTKWYGPLIQAFGIIVRTSGKDSEAAVQFLKDNPDFNEQLQLVAILEHLRNAKFNTKFPDPTPNTASLPIAPVEPQQEVEESKTVAEVVST